MHIRYSLRETNSVNIIRVYSSLIYVNTNVYNIIGMCSLLATCTRVVTFLIAIKKILIYRADISNTYTYICTRVHNYSLPTFYYQLDHTYVYRIATREYNLAAIASIYESRKMTAIFIRNKNYRSSAVFKSAHEWMRDDKNLNLRKRARDADKRLVKARAYIRE